MLAAAGSSSDMTTFFIPGVGSEPRVAEGAYRDMSGVIELEMGRRPNTRRILSLWTRRGSMDCITEVGSSDRYAAAP